MMNTTETNTPEFNEKQEVARFLPGGLSCCISPDTWKGYS